MSSDDEQEWFYDFECDYSLEEIVDRFNQSGPWQWQLRDNYFEGNYLNTRPESGVHLKIREYPQAFIQGPRDAGFSAVIRLNSEAGSSRSDIDSRFRALLVHIDARDVQSIDADHEDR